MVVDAQGEFVTQRELPRMALVRPQLKHHEVVLRAPGMLALHLAIDAVEEPVRVRVWDDEVAAFDMGAVAAQWFSDFLGAPAAAGAVRPRPPAPVEPASGPAAWRRPTSSATAIRCWCSAKASLGRPERAARRRPATRRWASSGSGRTSCWPAASRTTRTASPSCTSTPAQPVRLQPVKPCARCPIPDIDPATARPQHGGAATRCRPIASDARLDGAVTFGMNAIVREGEEQLLRVGQAVRGQWNFG